MRIAPRAAASPGLRPARLQVASTGTQTERTSRGVARASVYRVLDQLEGLGLVTKLEVGQGIARYEPNRPGADHHHHMVCASCGEVIPFADAELEATIDRVAERVTFDVSEHEIVLHGACADCRR